MALTRSQQKEGYVASGGFKKPKTGLASTNPISNIAPQIPQAGPIVDPKSYLTPEQIKGGYSTIPGGFNAVTGQSTTTLGSNKDKDILSNNLTAEKLYEKGVTTDPESGVSTTADGVAYEPNTNEEDQSIESYFKQIKSNTDAITASTISNIQGQYGRLKKEQERINQSTLAGTRSALLMSGAAQHDVYSEDAVQLRMTENLGYVQDLEDKENELINDAKQAQLTNNNRLLEARIAQVQQVRQEKIDMAKEVNKDIREQAIKARETAVQIEKDNSIAELYSMGVTDVPSILAALRAQGIQATSKEVSDALKNLVPAGLSDLMETLAMNNAPQEVKAKVMASKDINEAYFNAGVYGAGGTGDTAKYNRYVADATSRGQVPMGYNDFLTYDTNRLRKVTGSGGTGSGVGSNGVVGDPTKLLSISEAEKLGVPFGTTEAQAVAMGRTPGVPPPEGKMDELDLNISLVDELLLSPYLSQVTGVINPFTYWTPGTNEQLVKSQFQQLKSLLALENRQKLKGQGTISDREMKTLTEASTALNANLSDIDTKKEIEKIKNVFIAAKTRLIQESGYVSTGDSIINEEAKAEEESKSLIVNLSPEEQATAAQMEADNVPYIEILKWIKQQQ